MILTMVGEHNSGKTTYLGALWTTVKSADPDAPATLRDGNRPDRSADLDDFSHSLLACEHVERTRHGVAHRVELDLLIDGQPVLLNHFDVSGETYEHALEQRVAPESLMTALADTDALMLFLHPGATRHHQTIAEAHRMVEAATGERPPSAPPSEQVTEGNLDPVQVWKSAPTSVHLVELLQLVLEQRQTSAPLSVAIIISAWDTLDSGPDWGSRCHPEGWLKDELPLLHQFLKSNPESVRWRAFGVSAQGCDFGDQGAVDAMVDQPYNERTVVTTGEGRWTRDIAEPLRWFTSDQSV